MIEENIIHEKVKEIKTQLRLAMNGIVSSHQRSQGLNYKINFGVEIPRLKAIAAERSHERELALTLWKDNIRECKLLAIMLLPKESYSEVACTWTAEAPYTEIADHLAKNILCTLPDALENALENIKNPEGLFRYCGYMTLTHLFRAGKVLDSTQEQCYFNEAMVAADGSYGRSALLAARNSLAIYAECSEEATGRALTAFAAGGKEELLQAILG